MKNKMSIWGIIALVCAAAFTGCPAEDEALIRKELYGVKILSVTPDLIAGAEQQVAVTVEYNLQVNLNPHIQLIVAFNTVESDEYRAYGIIDITKKGSGTHTFNAAVTPVDWSAANGAFQVRAAYGFMKVFLADSGLKTSAVLASDVQALPLRKEEGYCTVTWHLNGGKRYWEGATGFQYLGRVAKGGVLARVRYPEKILSVDSNGWEQRYYFGGWYTDSALTQRYNFANSVTADLNLYAKWEELPSFESLYGTWVQYSGLYTLTITADTLRVENWQGDYVQYTNVVWTPDVNTNTDIYVRLPYLNGYTFTGNREYNISHDPSYFPADNIGFVAVSTSGNYVYLGRNTTQAWSYDDFIFRE
jgi:uncharacterized repeat protein (TIGR02543 family)